MKAARIALLSLLFLTGLLYVAAELLYSASRDRSDFGAFENAMRLTHLAFTLPLLLVPIVQFSSRLRSKRPGLHRALGRFYLGATMLAAIGAIYLGLGFDEPGRRVPLVIFAGLWFYFAVAAWLAAYRRTFDVHARFVVRTYGIALAFVLVRLLGQFDTSLLGSITNEEVRNVTREWLAFVVPLLLIEAGFHWRASGQAKRERQLRGPGSARSIEAIQGAPEPKASTRPRP